MNTIFKITSMMVAMAIFTGCEELQKVTPVPNTTAANLTANFLMVDASPDAPSLNLYVNNIIAGVAVDNLNQRAQAGYTAVPITTNGVGANSNIRVKATTGTIGGTLGSNDLIFRAGNNNQNNFVAAAGGSYTLIVVDTINRLAPVRTLDTSLTNNPAGNTYYYKQSIPTPGVLISASDYAALVPAEQLKCVLLGIVPLGSTDVGGPRFLVITDNLPLPAPSPVFPVIVPGSNKFSARFINASPDAGSATCKIGGTSLGAATYPLLQGSFNPSVGSRSTTVAFVNAITTGSFSVTISAGPVVTPLAAQNFVDGGIYTIILSGSKAKNTLALTLIKNN